MPNILVDSNDDLFRAVLLRKPNRQGSKNGVPWAPRAALLLVCCLPAAHLHPAPYPLQSSVNGRDRGHWLQPARRYRLRT